jgi:hypothetical protein
MVVQMTNWTLMRMENRRRNKRAETDPDYRIGESDEAVIDGLQYVHCRYNMNAN